MDRQDYPIYISRIGKAAERVEQELILALTGRVDQLASVTVEPELITVRHRYPEAVAPKDCFYSTLVGAA
jgi:hypothetical protein